MEDRELLELGARAVGFSNVRATVLSGVVLGVSLGDEVFAKTGKTFWNPLTDDGDALRLAVKLGLFNSMEGLQEFQGFYSDELSKDNRPTLAARRAITTIAAEIGRNMK